MAGLVGLGPVQLPPQIAFDRADLLPQIGEQCGAVDHAGTPVTLVSGCGRMAGSGAKAVRA
ncbi:hypothetical protein OHA40_06145 [Nocardia sp. NBC_00508]|uniref:hypothetical protein n=1 Tax=Nocardia sp. NBC_00508 TaxID=2975992 RepID=UPI002E813659|nr:hypothetical protein [Nocardia sp. NBC_00508]WUD70219.1 hypothetical protein OHA40_06145 [Nocardia sp. NBC_00508]